MHVNESGICKAIPLKFYWLVAIASSNIYICCAFSYRSGDAVLPPDSLCVWTMNTAKAGLYAAAVHFPVVGCFVHRAIPVALLTLIYDRALLFRRFSYWKLNLILCCWHLAVPTK